MLATRHAAKQRQQFAAVQIRQAKIERQQRRMQIAVSFKGHAPAVSQYELAMTYALEQRTHQSRIDGLILDGQSGAG